MLISELKEEMLFAGIGRKGDLGVSGGGRRLGEAGSRIRPSFRSGADNSSVALSFASKLMSVLEEHEFFCFEREDAFAGRVMNSDGEYVIDDG